MNKLNKISKIFLFIFAASGAIWLGSYISRLSLFYQLFQGAEFLLKEFVTDKNLSGIFQTLIAVVSINMLFYLIMLIMFLMFLITAKLSLKQNGWLFISMILIFLTAPFEIYLMTIDYEIVTKVFSGNFDQEAILELVIKRFKVLSSFAIVEILCYLAMIYLFIYQPLTGLKRRLAE
jgi:uncharacterized membrane protein